MIDINKGYQHLNIFIYTQNIIRVNVKFGFPSKKGFTHSLVFSFYTVPVRQVDYKG